MLESAELPIPSAPPPGCYRLARVCVCLCVCCEPSGGGSSGGKEEEGQILIWQVTRTSQSPEDDIALGGGDTLNKPWRSLNAPQHPQTGHGAAASDRV